MPSHRYMHTWGHLFLLCASVTEILSICDPICEEYYSSSPLPALQSDRTESLAVTHQQAYDSLLRLRNGANVSLFSSMEACGESPATYCSLRNVTHFGGGNFSANVSCADVERIRGSNGILVMEMESLQVHKSDCLIIIDVFVFHPGMHLACI